MLTNKLNSPIPLKTAVRMAMAATMVVSMVAVQDGSARAGTRIVVRAQSASKVGFAINRSAEIGVLESRINASGIASATVQAKGDDEIVIELSSVQPNDPFVASLTSVGLMTFRYMPDVANNDPGVLSTFRNRPVVLQMATDPVTGGEICKFYDKRTRQFFRDGFHIREEYASIASDSSKRTQAAADVRELAAWNKFLSTSKVIITSKDIRPTSRALIDPSSKRPVVTQEFTPAGTAKMKAYTSKHMNTIMAIMLDDRVLTAPQITGVIGNRGELSGGIASVADAKNLAGMFNSGPLPVRLKVVSVEAVR